MPTMPKRKAFKTLMPLKEKPEYFESIEKQIVQVLKAELYYPLLRDLEQPIKRLIANEKEDLLRAIQAGHIQYVRGHFEGRLNSTLSRELRSLGAKWERTQGWWKLPLSKLTPDVRIAIGASSSKFDAMAKRMDRHLQTALPDAIADKLSLAKVYDSTIYKVNRDFEASVKGIAVPVKFTPAEQKKIRDEYTTNMKLYIQDFTEKEIEKLRKKIQAHAQEGFRFESVVKTIQESYSVSQSKAKFLARQETSLLMTQMRKMRYQSAGVNKYKWVNVNGSPDHPVRPMHKALGDRSRKGELFTWDNPPTVDEHGSKKHPGQDFNCRCIALPVVEF